MIKRFNRYEIKYSIPAASMRHLMPDLMRFLRPDPHSTESGFYKVASLYFDTPGLDCYRNKIDGLLFRRKLRIRIYPDAPNAPAFVEIKQRINRTVQKRRLAMTLPDAYRLCSGDMRFELSEPDDQEVADEIHCLVRSLRLVPQNVISYTRQAWEGYFMDPGLRVTFDTMIRTRRASFDLEQPRREMLAYPAGKAVMEVKANERVPHWLVTLLARHECNLDRISKYCHGISQIMQQERLRWETV
ncbi:MAG: polyphosphate polymerase domain-containing protein [Planctomycetes bacterium]|nr:polyphosphate polymerase domain-containing protein [Planctomycetota bacterium]